MPSPLKQQRTSARGEGAISEFTTERLSIYLRCLVTLEAASVSTVSSRELAERFHLNSAQIRKDLACIGELGIRGVGYSVSELKGHLVRTLGIDTLRRIVIFGAGNLGSALADHYGFNSNGFAVVALFDDDPAKQGRLTRNGIPILDDSRLAGVVRDEKVEIGIIAVPPEAAQAVLDQLVDAGIKAVLNFSPVQIRPKSDVAIKSVDMRINLETLSFALSGGLRTV